MGREKKTTKTETDQTQEQEQESSFTQQATATPLEASENAKAAARLEGREEITEDVFTNALNLINVALTGGEFPGQLKGLFSGISSETIGTEAARVARNAQPGFQALGLSNSGVAFRETAREVGESVLFPAEAFNIQNLLNIANLGLGGQSALESQQISERANLGSRLAGLRSISGTSRGSGTTNISGSTSTTVTSPNPFVSSFQTSFGTSLGQTGSTALKSVFS